jgi:threonine dehydrogenase-like Zn-dependent dehydrogenase
MDVGGDVRNLRAGDRVVIPFVIARGECAMCRLGLTAQCETTQNRESRTGASLYG